MGDRVELTEATIPRSLEGSDGEAFREMVALRNAVEEEAVGSTEFSPTAEELLPFWQNMVDEPKRLVLARADGRVVGRGTVELPPEEGSTTAYVSVEVLADYRDAGIGTALLDRVEGWAGEAGRTTLKAFVTHGRFRGGPALRPPTGFGEVAADAPEVRFAIGRGYRLEQIERMSRLSVEAAAARLGTERDSAARHADGYTLETIVGALPEAWLDDMAVLQHRMSTDAPMAGLELDEEVWDAARVRRMEADRAAGGRLALTTAARHDGSGRLVAFTELLVPAERRRTVFQDSTLVLREHRGHRLGMLVKAVNLLALREASPESSVVTTFNAEENRPMLRVNEALGFEAVGAEGGWRKDVAPRS
jgi:GNAT superfamily N-acetyltransferase